MKEKVYKNGLIALLTDFGLCDWYVGVMKGVILSINPSVDIVDISHDISPQNIIEGAFVLSQAVPFFPEGTIYVAVVDPGVGTSARLPILVETERFIFVGPDNGIFGLSLQNERVRNIIHLTNRDFFLKEITPTFHARDIFSPVAAYLSLGIPPDIFGKKAECLKKTKKELPLITHSTIKGAIVHIDRFGNLITNIRKEHLEKLGSERFFLKTGNRTVRSIVKTYADAKKGDTIMLIGSSGMLEVARKNGSAANELGAKLNDSVIINMINRS